MDESALTLGTIDVSYLPNSAEYSVGQCKHASEEWVSFRLKCGLKVASLKTLIAILFMKVEMLEPTLYQQLGRKTE